MSRRGLLLRLLCAPAVLACALLPDRPGDVEPLDHVALRVPRGEVAVRAGRLRMVERP